MHVRTDLTREVSMSHSSLLNNLIPKVFPEDLHGVVMLDVACGYGGRGFLIRKATPATSSTSFSRPSHQTSKGEDNRECCQEDQCRRH